MTNKSLTDVYVSNSHLKGRVKACEIITECLEGKPIPYLQKATKTIYKNFIIPIYNALSHGSIDFDKESFNRLLGYVGLYESLLDQEKGITHSDGKTILGNANQSLMDSLNLNRSKMRLPGSIMDLKPKKEGKK